MSTDTDEQPDLPDDDVEAEVLNGFAINITRSEAERIDYVAFIIPEVRDLLACWRKEVDLEKRIKLEEKILETTEDWDRIVFNR